MSTRDIQAHLRERYGTDVSHEFILKATERVVELFRECKAARLTPSPHRTSYLVHLDALCVSTRDDGQGTKRAFYIALGVGLDGRREALGIWAAPTEGAKFWLTILTELKNRTVEYIFFIYADWPHRARQGRRSGFPQDGHADVHRALDHN